jgi:hypothetical protein
VPDQFLARLARQIGEKERSAPPPQAFQEH